MYKASCDRPLSSAPLGARYSSPVVPSPKAPSHKQQQENEDNHVIKARKDFQQPNKVLTHAQ
jgi:hypothetical protein